MIVLQANHIEKQFQGTPVLQDCNVVIQHGDRVALLGPNGAGKTTLLRILVGLETPDGGTLAVSRDTTMGYVAQFLEDSDESLSLFAFVAESFRHLLNLEEQIRGLEQAMARPEVYENPDQFQQIANAYDTLRKEFADANGFAMEARVRRVLDGLAFPQETWDSPVYTLSGGQKTRLALARLLAQEPTLLMLDEPTNYLDTDTLTWLENYLKGYDGALLLVSHDRYFLDSLCTVVYELSSGKTERYTGNYTDYTVQKAQQLELEGKRFEAQQAEITRLETFVEKNLARASTSNRAKSRRKLLERMNRLEKPDASVPVPALQFHTRRQSGRDVLHIEHLSIGYGAGAANQVLFENLSLNVHRGQRVAILGPNGIGKTTLLKTLMGQIPAIAGNYRWGTNVDIGYYDQEQEDLDGTKTVLDLIYDEFADLTLTAVRTALGRFLFRGEDVEKPVSALSGGELSRLALCRLMLHQPNLLVMDEPTNHLDLFAKEALEEALSQYEGTLLFVSHDRYFIDALATHVLHLDRSGYRLYPGNYSEYLQKRMDENTWEHAWGAEPSKAAGSTGQGTDSSLRPGQSGAPLQAAGNNSDGDAPVKATPVRSADMRKQRERVARLEQEIEQAEGEQEEVSGQIVKASIASDVASIQTLQARLATLSERHQRLLEEWETAAAKLEAMERQDAQARNS